jgi:hypothetical protein
MSREQKNEFETRLKSIKEGAWGKTSVLGNVPGFKTLNSELDELGLKACTSWACPHPIKSMSQFRMGKSHCKTCHDGEGERARVAAGRRAKTAVANAVAAKHDAAKPDKFPSEAQLDELDKRIEQHETLIQMGIESRAAKDAAKEAKAAAAQVAEDRVAIEAAAASSSGAGPSHVTNNITINNNFNGSVSEPAAKRLCQSSIRGFLM